MAPAILSQKGKDELFSLCKFGPKAPFSAKAPCLIDYLRSNYQVNNKPR